MSLILVQETASAIPVPAAGKGTVFLNTSNELSVKNSSNAVSVLPTINSSTNTYVIYNNAGAFGQSANFAFNETTNTLTIANLSVTGNLQAGDISVSSIANGTSNVDIVGVSGNVTTSVGGNANILVVTGTGVVVSGNLTANGSVGNGIVGGAKTSGSTRGTGVTGQGYVTSSTDTGAAVGVRGFATDTHSGGYNVGVLGNASGSGLGNYAFYVQAGNIASIETPTAWDLYDNSPSAISFNSSGKANILGIETTDGAEGVFTSGYLNVTGNVTASRLISNIATGTAPLTVTSTTRVANLNVATSGVANTVNDAAQPNITSVGTLTGVSVSGNANIGNIGTGGLITATGNIGGGNINTGGVVSATGNITGGNLITAGVVSATGNVTGNYILGNGALLTGVITSVANINNGTSNVTVVSSGGNITVGIGGTSNVVVWATTGEYITGILSVSGNANVGNLGTAGLITATGNIGGGNINTGGLVSATGNITGANLITGGLITATGNVSANNFIASNRVLVGDGSNASPSIAFSSDGATDTGFYWVSDGVIGVATNGAVRAQWNASGLSVTGVVTATGNITGANLVTGGALSVGGNANIGNVGATLFVGNLSGTGNSNVGNLGATGIFATTLSSTGNSNVGNLGTGGLITATGNIGGGNLNTSGILSVSGTGVSSINGNLNMNSKYVVSLSDPVNLQDAATKAYVDQQVSTGLTYHTPVAAATTTTLASTTGGTITYTQPNGVANGVGAYISTTGTFTNIDGYAVNVGGTRILVKDEANAVFNGIYQYTNATAITRTADADEYGSDSANALSLNDYFFVQNGTTNKGTAYVVSAPTGTITFGTSNITFALFSTAQVYTAGTGIGISGTTISANASQTQVTAVGTLTSLSVSGNANIGNVGATLFVGNLSGTGNSNVGNLGVAGVFATTLSSTGNANIGNLGTAGLITAAGNIQGGNIITGGLISATGNITAGNLISGGGSGGSITGANLVSANYFTGTLTTAAQPNITSVGTLTSVSVSGNANIGNIGTAGIIVSSIATGTAPFTVTSTTRVANLNVAYANVSDFSAVTTATSGNYYVNFVNALTGNIQEYANAAFVANTSNGALYATTFVGALSGAATSATTAGTVTTAAQPNITSVGTLTSLSSSGNITGANLIVSSSGSLLHSVNAAVSAAGTVQANATALLNDINVITTCASGAGVVLPTAVAGMRKLVFNTTANACLVYPASGAAINAGAANASYSLAAGARLEYISTSTTQWYTVNATYA